MWWCICTPPETAGPALWRSYPEGKPKASGLLAFSSLSDQFIFILFTPMVHPLLLCCHFTLCHWHEAARPLLEVSQRGHIGKNRKDICMLMFICWYVSALTLDPGTVSRLAILFNPAPSCSCWTLPWRVEWYACSLALLVRTDCLCTIAQMVFFYSPDSQFVCWCCDGNLIQPGQDPSRQSEPK